MIVLDCVGNECDSAVLSRGILIDELPFVCFGSSAFDFPFRCASASSEFINNSSSCEIKASFERASPGGCPGPE